MDDNGPLFYTVPEVADVLRVESTTIYRAIREDAFPAVRIRGRYIVPAEAIHDLAAQATHRGGCIDVARINRERHLLRQTAAESSRPDQPVPRAHIPRPRPAVTAFRPTSGSNARQRQVDDVLFE
jgi:excisionase family DNA binding protein